MSIKGTLTVNVLNPEVSPSIVAYDYFSTIKFVGVKDCFKFYTFEGKTITSPVRSIAGNIVVDLTNRKILVSFAVNGASQIDSDNMVGNKSGKCFRGFQQQDGNDGVAGSILKTEKSLY